MKFGLYSIFDNQSRVFAPPFVAVNDVLARRFCLDEVIVGNSLPSRYPSDFDLYKICDWIQPSDDSVELGMTPPAVGAKLSFICNFANLVADRKDEDR